MPDVTAAQARDIYNNLEDWIVTILKAQTNITDLLGTRGEDASIEAGLRDEIREYIDGEVPAIAIETISSDDDDNEEEGSHTEIINVYELEAFVISQGADRRECKTEVNQVVAEVEHYLRQQINSTKDLAAQIGGSSNPNLKLGTTVFETLVEEDESLFRVLGRIRFSIDLDLDVN